MKIKEELLIKQAKEGYTVCYADQCPLHNHCLRWLVGQHVPTTRSSYHCVNPHFEGVASDDCPMYRNDQKVRFAKGMLHIFTDDMPKRVESVQMICPSVWSLLSATESSALPTAPTTSSIATARASFPLPCNRLSATCSAKTDGQAK